MAEEKVNHPSYYGGDGNPYETIKVIEEWGLDRDFLLGNTIKYISRAGKKSPDALADLEKAQWYLARKIENLKRSPLMDGGGRPAPDNLRTRPAHRFFDRGPDGAE